MVNNFKRDNIKGKKGEAIALKVLRNLTNDYTFDDVSDDQAFWHIGDIDVYDEWWNMHYFIDVKTDDCIYKTGNILCEERVYYLDGAKKGFMYSNYDYLAIVSRPNNCIYIINFEVLKKYYKQGRYMRMAYEDQSSDTYLYPLSKAWKVGAVEAVIKYDDNYKTVEVTTA